MRLGLRGRILLLVLVALAPPTVVAFTVALEERNEAREHAQQDLLATATWCGPTSSASWTRRLRSSRAISRELAERPDRRSCEKLLGARAPLDRTATARWAWPSPTARVRCGATRMGLARPMEQVNVARADWFRAAQRTGGFVLGDLGQRPADSEPWPS